MEMPDAASSMTMISGDVHTCDDNVLILDILADKNDVFIKQFKA
jgi:hypothetical protein